MSVGNRGGVIGNQAIIAFVVFGRFSEGAAQALGLATLVLTGGLAQVTFLSIVLPLKLYTPPPIWDAWLPLSVTFVKFAVPKL